MIRIILGFIFRLPLMLPLIYRDIVSQRNKVHLYGIWGYFGLPGRGKTMCMCHRLKELRKEYGDKIYIMTNFAYTDEDFAFTGWRQLLKPYDKPLVVAWDEIQNEFESRGWKDFPVALLTSLTQVRKGNGVQILYTSQRWHFVDKNFRSLSFGCYECGTIAGRYTYCRLFDPVDYDNYCSQSDYNLRMRIKPLKIERFIQTDALRNSYDSFKMLQSAKAKEYMNREELARIRSGYSN